MLSQNQPQKTTVEDAIEEIKQNLLMLRKSEKSLELIVNQLNDDFNTKDEALKQHAEDWGQHWEKCFDELANQFAAIDLPLTNKEKNKLRKGSATYSTIQEKLQNLESRKLSLPSKMTSFAILAYDTIVAVLSRNLQKIDKKSVKNIAKKLDIISDENNSANKVNANYTEVCKKNLEMLKQLEDQIGNVPLIPAAMIERFRAIEQRAIQQINKATEMRKLEETEQQTLV